VTHPPLVVALADAPGRVADHGRAVGDDADAGEEHAAVARRVKHLGPELGADHLHQPPQQVWMRSVLDERAAHSGGPPVQDAGLDQDPPVILDGQVLWRRRISELSECPTLIAVVGG